MKEVQLVLDLPELKIIKLSDTYWLAHERCVKAVKAIYSAIVNVLNNINEQTHEPKYLGISRALCKQCIFLVMFFHKLSRAFQVERIILTAPTLNTHHITCGKLGTGTDGCKG